MYDLRFHEDALQEFLRLDGSVRQHMKVRLAAVQTSPSQSSHPLNGLLTGFNEIKLLKAGIRAIYRIDVQHQRIDVISIGKRERLQVFAVALERLADLL